MIAKVGRPVVSKKLGEWESFCYHGTRRPTNVPVFDLAKFRTWRQALAYARQHVEDAHACVSTP